MNPPKGEAKNSDKTPSKPDPNKDKDPGPNSPRVALRLGPIEDVALEPGQSKTLDVRAVRDNCKGPIELRLEGLPEGVRVRTGIIATDATQGTLKVSTDDKVKPGTATAQLVAVAGEARAERMVRFTIRLPRPGKEITNSINMRFVRIPAGKFLMGSPKEEAKRGEYETQHEVEVTRPFYVGVYEVTQGQYERTMDSNPSYFSAKGGGKDKVKGMDTQRFPVENVSWNDAVKFCERLPELPEEKLAGRSYRLPTEAEWEYACRGGATSSKSFHFGDSLTSTQANMNGNLPYGGAPKGDSLQRTCEVGSFKPNGFGLFDMHGNVYEWCQDWYGPYDSRIVKDPKGQATSPENRRVLRGGTWDSDGRNSRSAGRAWYDPAERTNGSGFRVVCVLGIP